MEKNVQKSTLNRSGAVRLRCEFGIEKYINHMDRWNGRKEICFQLLQQHDPEKVRMYTNIQTYTNIGKGKYYPIEYKTL